MEVLEGITVTVDLKKAGPMLHVQRTGDAEQVQRILEEAAGLFAPKAVYSASYVEAKDEEGVLIGGERFQSRVLRKNLDSVGRVFPFVVTLGSALEQRAGQCEDLLEKYYFDVIGNIALVEARKELQRAISGRYALGRVSFMSPGSLPDWPIEEQIPLFTLLGGVEPSIGVRLNESLLMIPRKSVSGIFFPTETSFYSCQLCPRERCEGRRAPYSESLARDYGILP